MTYTHTRSGKLHPIIFRKDSSFAEKRQYKNISNIKELARPAHFLWFLLIFHSNIERINILMIYFRFRNLRRKAHRKLRVKN